jgi:phi13 family phage major tail protein
MDKIYGEFVGVDNLYAALITTDTSSSFVTGTPFYLAPAGEIAGAPTVNKKTTYYDNSPANTYTTEGETEVKCTVPNLPASIAATVAGKYYSSADGRVYDTGIANPPYYALGFRYNMGNDDYRYYWYAKGTFSMGSEDAKSKETDVDVKTYELTYTAITTTHKWTINSESKPLKRVFADTADSAFDSTGWFSAVQTPDTTSAPSAIALSSIVPADDATSVAVNTTIVLTFNNKIAEDSVTVISAAGVIVAVTKAYNSTGKILTITPSTNLSTSTTYIVSVAGVVDIYGQALTATAKNFATAS